MKQAVPPRRRVGGRTHPPSEPVLGGRYVLEQPLGAGAVAEVRAAQDTRLDRPVAVKLLRTDLADEPGARQRFEAEARAAAALSHPNIVAVFDVDVDERPYLVMERLPGRTLADEIAKGPMEPARVIDAGAQVLAALAAAHSAGIVHRDVKPGNVLLAPDGTWKVADFGIAKSTESADALTTPGIVLCTPGYVAPERLDGEQATAASDLYSVGVLLFEALAGERPFVADTPLAVAHLAKTQTPKRLDAVRPGLDPTLVDVVHRALDRDPKRRFGSASEMRDALVGVDRVRARRSDDDTVQMREPEPTATQSVPTGFEPVRPASAGGFRRWRGLALLTWAVVAVIAVVVVVALLGNGDAPSPPTEITPETEAPAPAPRDSDAELPSLLEDALERLEDEVQP